MAKGFIVTGTDTGLGKTVFCAALTQALNGAYWKPIQAGRDDETDRQVVARLSQRPPTHILPEAYILNTPCSPHRAADIDGIEIQPSTLAPPQHEPPLIIEGAGGILVPITLQHLQIDLFAQWRFPVILVARTTLGTINHTLLSVEALKSRNLPIHGIAFVGGENKNTQETIERFSGLRILGRLPHIEPLNTETLRAGFEDNFDNEDF